MNPPEGFEPHFRRSAVTDPWEPLYSRRAPGVVEIGVWLRPEHCNSRGFAHGGVVAALADNAMGLSLVSAMEAAGGAPPGGLVTVSLAIDYAGSGKQGQWLVVTPRVLKAGRSMGFVDALIRADDSLVARGSATFRVA